MNSLKQNNNDYYRQLIVKHYSNPENKGLLKTRDSLVFHHFTNSCVDDFFVELTFNNDIVTDAKFEGLGCAISTASVDMFCGALINKDRVYVQDLKEAYENMLEKKAFNTKILGDLIAFENVLKQPNRLKCALIISQSISEILLMKAK